MRLNGGTAASALGALLALTTWAPAWAQNCETSCEEYVEGECVEYHQTCTYQPPALSYGAIAYGPTSRAWGYSYSWDSQDKAESVAMQNCAQHGDDCEVMVWFEHKCGAVSQGDGTEAYWGLGDTDGEARADAQNKCASGGATNCQVQVSQCSN